MISKAIQNKCEDAGASVCEIELVTELIAAVPKHYVSSINTQKSWMEQDGFLITVKVIIKDITCLYQMQKARNINMYNDNDKNGQVMLINVYKCFNRTCYKFGKKKHKKKSYPQNSSKTEDIEKRLKGEYMGQKIKMQAKGLKVERSRMKAEKPKWNIYLQMLSLLSIANNAIKMWRIKKMWIKNLWQQLMSNKKTCKKSHFIKYFKEWRFLNRGGLRRCPWTS